MSARPEGARGLGLSLIGARGSGKSTVGRCVAQALCLQFVDADVHLEARVGQPISDLFREQGEPVFRDWEERILAELVAGPPLVLATGGGVVLRESNRARLRAFGLVVWLRADAAMLAERLGADPRGVASRPSLTGAGTLEEIDTVLRVREPIYEATADHVLVTTGRTVEAVVQEVVASHRDWDPARRRRP